MRDKYEVINEAIKKLSQLTGEDFHGYRSEIWNVISSAMGEQEQITKQACSDACLSLDESELSGNNISEVCANICLHL